MSARKRRVNLDTAHPKSFVVLIGEYVYLIPYVETEEEALLEAFEADEFQSGLTPSRKKMIEAAAAQTFKKTNGSTSEFPAEI